MLPDPVKNRPDQTNKCRECESPMIGRSDKKYCSVECRNAYNNRKNSSQNNYMRNIDNILRRNRLILKDLLKDGIMEVNCSLLNALGFDFNYFTCVKRPMDGNEEYYCYEIGYSYNNSGNVLILNIDEGFYNQNKSIV